MSKGTSKRIKRHMSQLIITGKPKKGPIKMKFNKASFNNTQRFSKRGTNDAMYEKDLQIQQADLIQMRSNADFLKDESAYLAKLVKEQAPLLNEDATDDDVASILNSFELLWFSHHGINHKYLTELAYLFEATYQVGNQQSPKTVNRKRRRTKELADKPHTAKGVNDGKAIGDRGKQQHGRVDRHEVEVEEILRPRPRRRHRPRPSPAGRKRPLKPPEAQLARGSKASRTTSANRLAASTSTNMKMKAAIRLHHTMGSRASSMRAALIIVPKLMVLGSTPMPT